MDLSKEDITQNEIPKSVLVKVCKQVLPPATSISGEAKEALLKATTVFINYLTATALDLSDHKDKLGETDIYKALEALELDSSILGPVREAVGVNQLQRKEKRDEYRKKKMQDVGNGTTEDRMSDAEMDALDDNQEFPTAEISN
jgi:DNA polymerase epsilon subunit 3